MQGSGGLHQILADQVRFPDVVFIVYSRIPEQADPSTKVPNWIPNPAVEILSACNRRAEMSRKLRPYFDAGVEIVWYVDPSDRTVRVCRLTETIRTMTEADWLDGEQLLPGFRLNIREWFKQANRVGPIA